MIIKHVFVFFTSKTREHVTDRDNAKYEQRRLRRLGSHEEVMREPTNGDVDTLTPVDDNDITTRGSSFSSTILHPLNQRTFPFIERARILFSILCHDHLHSSVFLYVSVISDKNGAGHG